MGNIMNENTGVSRRDFLKGSVALGATAATGALLTNSRAYAETVQPEEITWDKEADVVVVGYGGAGAATAISAFDNGAEVLILEKMPEAGGNTIVSLGGFINTPDTEAAYNYTTKLFEYSLAELDEEVVRVFADECANNAEWVASLEPGMEPKKYGGASYKSVEGSDSQEKYQIPREGMRPGMSLFTAYRHAVEDERGIEVMLETPALRLVTNVAGEVIGVVADSAGQEMYIKARKGVALTTGGFEFDEEYKQNYLKGAMIRACGAEGNTGDGVRMAQAVGAKLWHMTGASALLAFEIPEEGMPMAIENNGFGIIVDKHCKRFMNEPALEGHAGLVAVDLYDSHNMEFPRIPCYKIFDDDIRKKAKLGWEGSGTLGAFYEWSEDNSVEIEKGWVPFADTLEELAEKMGLDPEALVTTVEKYNADVEAGEDTEWGRTIKSDDTVLSPQIITPPFYAQELFPTLLNTQGGPRRNAKAQIVDVFGEPIPRLYSAGELGSFWGIIYQGAGNNTESMVFGRIAGAELAALDNWE